MAIFLVGLTSFITDRVYFYNTQNILVKEEIEELEEEARLLRAPIQKAIIELKDSVQRLHDKPTLLSVLESASHDHLDELAKDFRTLLQQNPVYSKVRYVDAMGKELLRLDRKGPIIIRTSENKLQGIAGESYFNEAISIDAGKIYLSEIEPNREFGQIVRPITHVLRVAQPTYNKNDEFVGVIIINLNMSELLSELSQQVNNKRELFVTNTYGEYLWHPQRKHILGFTTQKVTIQDEFPKSHQVVEGSKRKLLAETVDGRILSYIALPFDSLDSNRLLGIGLSAEKNVLLHEVNALQKKNMLFSVVLIIIAAAIAILFSKLITKPLTRITAITEKFPDYSDADKKLTLDRRDEIGVLANSFNKLITQILEQEWLRNGHLELATKIRGKLTPNEVAYSSLQCLATYIGASLGAFYRLCENNSLVLLEGYAIKGNSKAKKYIESGDSILATVLEEGIVKIDNHLPDNYFFTHSGLGEARPTNRLIAPIVAERKIVALIELATLAPLSKKAELLLEQTAETIGMTLLSAEARDEIARMLEDSNLQQEELKVSNDELAIKTKELEESQDELTAKTAELETTNVSIEEKNKKLETQKEQLAKNTEEIKRKMEEVEQVSQYKSEFLANMSHELRTPLNSLLILAKSFQDNEDGNLTESQVEEAAMIYSGGVELLNLINDVLDFSKIEARKISIIKNNENIAGIVQKLIRLFLPLAAEKNIALKSEIDQDVPEILFTDVQRLEQILKNLLSNALKFTSKGCVKLKVSISKSNMIAFAVIDTGIGVDQKAHKDIFEAFKQEDGSIDRKYGGTGLGLAISLKLAKLLDGEIKVKSVKGVGSTFTLLLPLQTSNETTSETILTVEENNPKPSLSPLHATVDALPSTSRDKAVAKPLNNVSNTILIVEDDIRFAGNLSKFISNRGYHILTATTGKEALLMVQKYMPSVVILDLMLPDIDGLKVLEQLKADLKTRHIPVHILSASNDKIQDTLKKGAIGYLTKPINIDQMESMLAKVSNVNQNSIKNILVIEDDKNTQAAIYKLLATKELEVTTVSEGEAGLNKLKEKHFDCIILDLQLPDMTGFDWLEIADKSINIDASCQVPPVIVYTARQLSKEESMRLEEYTGSIIIKGAHSPERLMDEVMLFLHSVASSLSEEQHHILIDQHNPKKILESKKVLLVDDDMRNIFAMSKQLKKHGMEVLIADNGKMALDQLDKTVGIDLIVTDIMMPVMDGYETIEKIRNNPIYKDIPIIALTARAMPDERHKCLQAGANDYLAKPVDIDVLLTLMKVVLSKNKAVA
ncbi:response regulator [Spartinivicinus poritis]|uniref:histidine kinase n=1 Tax=Spartinivicinus poritis TaxID=2994640 RepID=A0ABT5U8X3_9GAMM|nr:response regulator [Spartinivicinus sp. A2-2]MDE1462752.1 response regulator [Spartinivicinus sp. A2-2]